MDVNTGSYFFWIFFLSTPNFWQYQNPQKEIHNEMNYGTKISFAFWEITLNFWWMILNWCRLSIMEGVTVVKTFSDAGSTETNQGEDEEDNKIDLTFLQKVC